MLNTYQMPEPYEPGITLPFLLISQDSGRLNDLPRSHEREGAEPGLKMQCPSHQQLTALSLGPLLLFPPRGELPQLIGSANSPEMGSLWSFCCPSAAPASGIIQC